MLRRVRATRNTALSLRPAREPREAARTPRSCSRALSIPPTTRS